MQELFIKQKRKSIDKMDKCEISKTMGTQMPA